jgi:putative aminopeptidase FrvX
MRFPTAALSLAAVMPLSATAQSADSLAVRFAAMTAVTGYEQAMTDSLLALLPGSTRDRAGNVTVTLGRGAPKRVVFCPLDEVGYVVGNVTDDGYLTLRRVGAAPLPNPIFDQQLEGHQVTLFGRRGPVPGVVGVRSTHLTRGRPAATDPPFTVDNAVVDVGATSRDEVLRLGIAILTPVALTKRPHVYGRRLLAAPAAERRAACAALATAVLSKPRVQGTVLVAFLVQTLFQRDDLVTLRTLHGPIDSVTESTMPIFARLSAKFEDTTVETVDLADADALVKSLVQWFGAVR